MHKPEKNIAQQLKAWSWQIIGLAALIVLIIQGMRQTMGLFVHPLTDNTSLDIVSISLALAFSQLLWGVFQPIMGAIADKKGPLLVLVSASLLLAAQHVALIWVDAPWAILLVWGVLAPAGAAAGGFSILIGLTAHLPPEKRSLASGIISSGASLGQFIFAPMVQFFIASWGYVSALIMLAGWSLANVPLVTKLCRLSARSPALLPSHTPTHGLSLKAQLYLACAKPGFWLLNGGFLAGGIQVGFIITHLPSEAGLWNISGSTAAWSLGMIGLFNIGGSLLAGALANRMGNRLLLAIIYLSRALVVALYLLAPKTEAMFIVFAAITGLNWLSTIPPTVGILNTLCGMRYFSTLFGICLLAHQLGAFMGAWLGGEVLRANGNYTLMWYLCLATSLLAAGLSWYARK